MVDIKPPTLLREVGSGFDTTDLMFSAWDGGSVFDYGQHEISDYETMLDRDGKAATLEQVLSLPIRQANWEIEPGPDDNGQAEFVRDVLTLDSNAGGMSTPVALVIGQMTSAFGFRKAFFEKVWKRLDGRVVYDKVAFRPASTCRVMRDKRTAAFRGFEQDPIRPEDMEPVKVPAQYAFVYIHGTHRDPLNGTSDLRIPYWCYKTKQKIRFLWYQFLEGQALPRTIVRADDSTSAEAAARKLIDVKSAGVVGLPKNVEVSTLDSGGRGAAEFQNALRWLDQESTQSVLAGFLDLTNAAASGHGSYALSKDQSDFFLKARMAVAREMEACINNYLLSDLIWYNFGQGASVPNFKFAPLTEGDETMATQLLTQLATSENSRIPGEFVQELAMRVASFLELDVARVEQAFKRVTEQASSSATSETEQRTLQVAAPVAAAEQAVRAATNTTAGTPG